MTTHVASGAIRASAPATSADAASPDPCAELDGPAAVGSLCLLAHLWRRPVADEIERWGGVAELEKYLERFLPVRKGRLSSLVDPTAMLDEYERLFVGPGPLPCSPYESFWRLDVPVDIRGSLMGPCTAELRRLYGELGLELSPSSGELPDHLAVELEAIIQGLSFDGGGDVARILFVDHLKTWLPRLCRAVLHEAEHPFYRELASATLDWLKPLGTWFDATLPVAASTP